LGPFFEVFATLERAVSKKFLDEKYASFVCVH